MIKKEAVALIITGLSVQQPLLLQKEGSGDMPAEQEAKETDWIGGQFTGQAVPGDEHRWIEEKGTARNYRIFRNRIRDYYSRAAKDYGRKRYGQDVAGIQIEQGDYPLQRRGAHIEQKGYSLRGGMHL
nr:hypothetical protein [uncultured Acetatifactor sp.]